MSQTVPAPDSKPRIRRSPESSLDIRRTHLTIRRGPIMAVCAHRRLGLFMGITHERKTMWSHDEQTMRILSFHHPDASRTAVSWPDAATAKQHLVGWLSFDDWSQVAIKSAQSDVCELPGEGSDPNAGPTMLCSLENCIRLIPGLGLLPQHELDPLTVER